MNKSDFTTQTSYRFTSEVSMAAAPTAAANPEDDSSKVEKDWMELVETPLTKHAREASLCGSLDLTDQVFSS